VVECRERSRVGGRGPEADVAIGLDQDHAAHRDTGADGIDTGVVRNLHGLRPGLVQPRERRGVCVRVAPANPCELPGSRRLDRQRALLSSVRFLLWAPSSHDGGSSQLWVQARRAWR
jgi:hypothetical protein